METKIVKASNKSIAEAANLIKKGELVAFPTETVYGLGANAFDENAVAKIFEAKGRPQDNPLIVHLSSYKDVEKVAKDIPDAFYALAKKFMPGPLTVVLSKGDSVPYRVTAGGETVAVRVPKKKWARKLIASSMPLAAPSANKSKHISPTTAKHTYDDLNGLIPMVLDGGPCEVGIESTVLDLTADIPTILRPGYVTEDMLLKVLHSVVTFSGMIKIAKSPGMKYTHYAPKVYTLVAKTRESMLAEYDRAVSEGKNPVMILRTTDEKVVKERHHVFLGKKPSDVSKNIYAAMLAAEKVFDEIIIENFGEKGLLGSVMNRVEKSAGHKEV